MHRLLVGTCVLALAVFAVQAADDKTEKTPDAKGLFKELRKEFGAASAEDRPKLLSDYGQKFLDHAAKNKQTEDGAEALLTILQLPIKDEKKVLKTKALDALTKDYVKSSAIGKPLSSFNIPPGDDDAFKFVKAVSEKNPHKTAKAYAVKVLLKASKQAKTLSARIKDNEAFRDQVEKALGKEAVKTILANAESADKDIKEYQAKLEGELKGVFPDLREGKPAPEVVSQDLEGKKVKLSDLKGKVVVLDVWATWCGPCRGMIPHTTELVEKMKGKPFVFVSISADDQKKTLTDFIKKTPMPWTHWWNGSSGGIVGDWEVTAFPTIYILDAKGVIRKIIVGADSKTVDQTVEKLVKEADEKTPPKTE